MTTGVTFRTIAAMSKALGTGGVVFSDDAYVRLLRRRCLGTVPLCGAYLVLGAATGQSGIMFSGALGAFVLIWCGATAGRLRTVVTSNAVVLRGHLGAGKVVRTSEIVDVVAPGLRRFGRLRWPVLVLRDGSRTPMRGVARRDPLGLKELVHEVKEAVGLS